MSDKHLDIAIGLTDAIFQIKGLADLIERSNLTDLESFPREVTAAIGAIQMIATKAVEEHAYHI